MNFRTKIILGSISLQVTLLTIIIISSLNIILSSNINAMHEHATALGETLASVVSSAVITNDLATLQEAVNKASNYPDVGHVKVLDPEGKVLAMAGDSTVTERQEYAEHDMGASLENGIITIVKNIMIGDIVFGRIEVYLLTKNIYIVVTEAKNYFYILAFLSTLLTVVFSLWFSTLLSKKLSALRHASHQIAEGKLGVLIPVEGSDEIAQTAVAFNKMSADIELANQRQNELLTQLNSQIFAMDQHAIVSISDVNGRISYANDKFCAISGYSRDELIGTSHDITQSGDHSDAFYKEMCKTISNGEVWSGEIKNQARDGSFYWVDSTIVPFLTSKGEPYQYTSIKTDITEYKETQLSLERAKEEADLANNAKSEFLANMSHEIRTPMNGVVGMIDLLKETPLETNQNEMVKTIRRSALSLLEIINDILDISKIESGHVALDIVPASFQDVMERAGATLGPPASNKFLDLLLYIDPNLPDWIQCDPMRLRQILLNLAGNAIKFTETDDHRVGRVVIRADLKKNEDDDRDVIQLKFIDNGIGMSEEGMSKLFKAFSQAESSTTRKFGGTGLGLSISKHLIELMGGEIGVESELGIGTTFSVSLPLEIAEDHEAPQKEYRDFEGLRALVASGDEEHGRFLTDYLENCGGNVTRSPNLSSVSDLLAAERDKGRSIDVVVLDDSWLDTKNIDLCKAIIEREIQTGVRFVITRNQGAKSFGEDLDKVTYASSIPLRRSDFLRSVAVATKRLSREIIDQALQDNLLIKDISIPSLAEAEAAGELVLVAEDILVNREIIRQQLNKLGYAVALAAHGAEALASMKKRTYGIVLTDLHMPGMDGYELATEIRAREETTDSRIPILAITAAALKSETDQCFEVGMDGFLTKPVELQRLKELMDKWLPKKLKTTLPDALGDARPLARKAEHRDGLENVVDPSILASLVGDDPDLQREFLNMYLEPAAEAVRKIHQAFEAHSPEQIGVLGHTLKSSSTAIGANALADLCGELEAAGKADEWEKIKTLYPHLDQRFGEVKTFIENEQANQVNCNEAYLEECLTNS